MHSPVTSNFVNVDIRSLGISVTSGDKLAIGLRHEGTGAYTWYRSGGNVWPDDDMYAGGYAYSIDIPGPDWFIDGPNDYGFQTYVNP